MKSGIRLKLFATLNKYLPPNPDNYLISPGVTVRGLLEELGIPEEEAKLVFIDSVKHGLDSKLLGGERVGIFPPVGGG